MKQEMYSQLRSTSIARVPQDDLGRELTVVIRIAADGRVYFHDIPIDMLLVAQAIAPNDAQLALRVQAAAAYRSITQ